jgi:hypothetical protein
MPNLHGCYVIIARNLKLLCFHANINAIRVSIMFLMFIISPSNFVSELQTEQWGT